jgi:SAM-dependent methyltransferase
MMPELKKLLGRAGDPTETGAIPPSSNADGSTDEVEALRARVRDLQAQIDELMHRRQSREGVEPELEEARVEIAQLSGTVARAVRRDSSLPLPPDALRLHVGTRTSASSFWFKGIYSADRVIEFFGTEPRRPVLDWGCGSGRTLLWLLRWPAWRAEYHGCDIDEEAIAWLAGQGVRNVAVCSPDPPLPYPDGFFGGLFAFSVLTHIHPQQHRSWYTELSRVLAPGGRAYLTTQGATLLDDPAHPVPEACRKEFDQRGFSYLQQEGHCKDAALVSEAFTRRALEGVLTLEDYARRGYMNMDAFGVRKPA